MQHPLLFNGERIEKNCANAKGTKTIFLNQASIMEETKMKFRNQSNSLLLCLGLLIFVLSVTAITHARVLEDDNVEVVYLFDEGEGEVAYDSSPNGREGSIIGAQWVDAVYGTGLQYDGEDDNLIIDGYAGVGGTDPRTVLFWFKSDSTRQHSWVKWGPNTAGAKYYIRAHPSGEECFLRIEVNGGQNYGNDNVCDGEWHHCALVFPNGADSVQDHHLYVDGNLQEKIGNDHVMDTGAQEQVVNIGARLTGHHFLHGIMDELAILSTALDEDQINDIKENGLHGSVSVDPKGKLATSWARIKKY